MSRSTVFTVLREVKMARLKLTYRHYVPYDKPDKPNDVIDRILRELPEGHKEVLENYVRAMIGDRFDIACVRLRLQYGMKLERVINMVNTASEDLKQSNEETAQVLYRELALRTFGKKLGIVLAQQ